MRLSMLESAAIGVSAIAALAIVKLHPLVVLELAGRGEERTLGQSRDALSQRIGQRSSVVGEGPRMHKLHSTGFVTQHDELHFLLISHRFNPTGNAHGTVESCGQVLDQGTSRHDYRP